MIVITIIIIIIIIVVITISLSHFAFSSVHNNKRSNAYYSEVKSIEYNKIC